MNEQTQSELFVTKPEARELIDELADRTGVGRGILEAAMRLAFENGYVDGKIAALKEVMK